MTKFNIDKPFTASELDNKRRRVVVVKWVTTAIVLAGVLGAAWSGSRPEAQKAHYAWVFIACGVSMIFGFLVQGLLASMSSKVFTEPADPPFGALKYKEDLHAKLEAYVAQVAEQNRPFTEYERICAQRLVPEPSGGGISTDDAFVFVVIELILNIIFAPFN